ncbi:MAG: hypothetical protein ACK5LZ_03415 [Anaerorhabdus sp.]
MYGIKLDKIQLATRSEIYSKKMIAQEEEYQKVKNALESVKDFYATGSTVEVIKELAQLMEEHCELSKRYLLAQQKILEKMIELYIEQDQVIEEEIGKVQ